ncbi:MAG: amino acid ABC transporter permease [Actinobacteria bacterium]|nr:amino acid ABC transporter permease [Actinomycetota bacterium]
MMLAASGWSLIWANHSVLLHALVRTLEISAIAIAGACVIGVVLGAARAYRIPVISQLAAVYVEVIRNTPILVQVFFIYFAFPQVPWIGVRFDEFTAACLGVMIWGGAFNIENFRAGFEAVPQRYREAGFALGFGRIATFRHVVFPIGGRIAIPPSINTYIAVLKNTAIAGPAVGFAELTQVSYGIIETSLRTYTVFVAIGIVYLVIVWTLSASIRLLESRLALPEGRR